LNETDVVPSMLGRGIVDASIVPLARFEPFSVTRDPGVIGCPSAKLAPFTISVICGEFALGGGVTRRCTATVAVFRASGEDTWTESSYGPGVSCDGFIVIVIGAGVKAPAETVTPAEGIVTPPLADSHDDPPVTFAITGIEAPVLITGIVTTLGAAPDVSVIVTESWSRDMTVPVVSPTVKFAFTYVPFAPVPARSSIAMTPV